MNTLYTSDCLKPDELVHASHVNTTIVDIMTCEKRFNDIFGHIGQHDFPLDIQLIKTSQKSEEQGLHEHPLLP